MKDGDKLIQQLNEERLATLVERRNKLFRLLIWELKEINDA